MTSLGDFLEELYSDRPTTKQQRPEPRKRPAAKGIPRSPETEEDDEGLAFSVPQVSRESSPVRSGATRGGLGAPSAGADASIIIATLADDGPLSIPALCEKTGMGRGRVLEAFQLLRSAGLVELVGPPGNEQVDLTPIGRQTAAAPP